MQIGLGVSQIGPFADADATRSVSVAAEAAGFSSLWAIDRLLDPVEPRSAYPASADGSLPRAQRVAFDPIVTLTLAAAVTERVRIGTGVLVAPWYPPALLARSLATLDRVSAGRLTVGLGVGWSLDEYEATGAPMRRRGVRLEEVLEVMGALWRDGVTDIDTSRESVVASNMGVKPVQRPGPPVLLAAYTSAGLERIARRADGWIPTGLPLDVIAPMWTSLRQTAERYGRDPEQLQLVVRAEPKLTYRPAGSDRAVFAGTTQQVRDDIDRVRALGATELILDLQSTTSTTAELLDTALELAQDELALVGS
jgi:probable F420-dependent oxidoreductase